jgi:hypothetical protein
MYEIKEKKEKKDDSIPQEFISFNTKTAKQLYLTRATTTRTTKTKTKNGIIIPTDQKDTSKYVAQWGL